MNGWNGTNAFILNVRSNLCKVLKRNAGKASTLHWHLDIGHVFNNAVAVLKNLPHLSHEADRRLPYGVLIFIFSIAIGASKVLQGQMVLLGVGDAGGEEVSQLGAGNPFSVGNFLVIPEEASNVPLAVKTEHCRLLTLVPADGVSDAGVIAEGLKLGASEGLLHGETVKTTVLSRLGQNSETLNKTHIFLLGRGLGRPLIGAMASLSRYRSSLARTRQTVKQIFQKFFLARIVPNADPSLRLYPLNKEKVFIDIIRIVWLN